MHYSTQTWIGNLRFNPGPIHNTVAQQICHIPYFWPTNITPNTVKHREKTYL